MSPSRRVRLSAIACLFVTFSMAAAAPAGAQFSPFADDALRAADLGTDPLTRSPGLAGMGRLTFVGSDPHHRITLWDFAGNPTGVSEADSSSTLDLRPGAGGASDVNDLLGTSQVRQTFAAHGTEVGYEAWKRQGDLAYGAIGNLGSAQVDRPFSDDVEHRRTLSAPWAMPVLNGVLPFTHSGRTRYALDIQWGEERVDSKYLAIIHNAGGDFISHDSEELDAPNVLLPQSYDVRQIGGGAALSHVFGSALTAAARYEGVAVRIHGDDQGKRNDAHTSELRPYNIGEATLIGHVGSHIDWGVDGRGWRSTSEESWAFTISAGQGVAPLTGRGKLLEREEEGSSMRTRLLWHGGAFDFGGGINTNYQKVTTTPPSVDDRSSFNYFLNTVFATSTADSISLADSVVADVAKLHAWDGGLGLAWHLPGRRGIAGIEYHRSREILDSETGGQGPRPISWDVRTGIEFGMTAALEGRAGYQFRWFDLDDFTHGNEYRSHLGTVGVGLHPPRSIWTLDLSYGVSSVRADFGDPTEPRGTRQQFVSQVHWAF
jgi:hypothetical protein